MRKRGKGEKTRGRMLVSGFIVYLEILQALEKKHTPIDCTEYSMLQ